MKRIPVFSAIIALSLFLAACSNQQVLADSDPSLPASVSSVPVLDSAGEEEDIPVPGCSLYLPRPLQVFGKTSATSFAGWSATDIEGNTVTQEVLKGSKLTLVGAWSSYCNSCIEDLKALQEVYESYDRETLNVLGVVASAQEKDGSVREGEIEIVRQLQELTGAAFPQLLPSDDLIQIKLKDLRVTPEVFLLDSEGNIIGDSLIGQKSADEYRKMVDDALKTLNQEETSK